MPDDQYAGLSESPKITGRLRRDESRAYQSARSAAKQLGVSLKRVTQLITDGKIAGWRAEGKTGRQLYFFVYSDELARLKHATEQIR